MYELTVKGTFCAAHALMIGGEREPLHGHTWRVTLAVRGEHLDADGLLVDFHALEAALRGILRRWDNQNLNEVEEFVGINPTAENVARRIADSMEAALPTGVTLRRAKVTEAPGCAASYLPRRP